MPTINNDGDVNIDDVAFAEFFLVRNTMAYNMINRCAGCFWERDTTIAAAVIQRCGDGVVFKCIFMAQTVEFFGCDAGHDMRCDHIQRFSGKLASFAHAFKTCFGVKLNAFACIFGC